MASEQELKNAIQTISDEIDQHMATLSRIDADSRDVGASGALSAFETRRLDALQRKAIKILDVAKNNLDAALVAFDAGLEDTDTQGPIAMQGMEDFFHAVGRSMLNAQEHLDRQSLSYSAARPAPDMGALFRIPKVTAEMRFGLTRTDKNGVNVLFYKDEEEDVQTLFNRVTFDVVAVPPPPDILDEIVKTSPQTRILQGHQERAAAMALLRAAAEENAEIRFEAMVKDLEGRAGRTMPLIIQSLPAEVAQPALTLFVFLEPGTTTMSDRSINVIAVTVEGEKISADATKKERLPRILNMVLRLAGLTDTALGAQP